MRYLLLVAILLIAVNYHTLAQGCVAIRSTGGLCIAEQADHTMADKSYWLFNTNVRYFRSFRHFVGTEEQKQRVDQGTEVVNYATSVDFTLSRVFNKRWSLALDVPVLNYLRSSKYEHYGNNSTSPNARQHTRTFGIGDIRIAAYYWLLDPAKSPKGNIQAGLGLKLPTGDYKYQDFFQKNDSTKILGPVDQSIQLGDGGTGFTTEVNAFYNVTRTISVYGNFYYLINPREQNGVSTGRGEAVSTDAIKYGSSVMSVPDQLMARAGVNWNVQQLTVSAGVREECLPSKDLVGGNSGFRRPGYIVSIEPGLSYKFKAFSAYAFVPVALKRNRTQSYSDKLRTQMTGKYSQGDAAFADYTVNIGVSFRF